MAVTLDIGNKDNIHPLNKQDVAKRLALWAFAKTYNIPGTVFSGPLFKSYKTENGKIRIDFDYAEGGLYAKTGSLSFFQIAGRDKVFRAANASISGSSVLVHSDAVPDPVAVRYAFNNTDSASLVGIEGLPASTFRTDDWPILADEVLIESAYDRTKDGFYTTMFCDRFGYEIHYTSDNSEPLITSPLYTGALIFKSSCTIKARAFLRELPSASINQITLINHLGLGRAPVLLAAYNPQYPGSGSSTLTDGIRGTSRYWDGSWQGYRGNGPEVIIDLGSKTTVHKISGGFLEDTRSWILLPEKVEFFTSTDARKFKKIKTIKNPKITGDRGPTRVDISYDDEPVTTRFIKIKAKPAELPGWHPGKGESAWIFIDEVIVQ